MPFCVIRNIGGSTYRAFRSGHRTFKYSWPLWALLFSTCESSSRAFVDRAMLPVALRSPAKKQSVYFDDVAVLVLRAGPPHRVCHNVREAENRITEPRCTSVIHT
jgi:hypothetical protein